MTFLAWHRLRMRCSTVAIGLAATLSVGGIAVALSMAGLTDETAVSAGAVAMFLWCLSYTVRWRRQFLDVLAGGYGGEDGDLLIAALAELEACPAGDTGSGRNVWDLSFMRVHGRALELVQVLSDDLVYEGALRRRVGRTGVRILDAVLSRQDALRRHGNGWDERLGEMIVLRNAWA